MLNKGLINKSYITMFQGLTENAPIYILDKGCPHKLTIGYVERVSNPVPKDGQIGVMPVFGQPPQEMVVDIFVKVGDSTQKLEKLPASKSATTPEHNPSIFVTESWETMLTEVENIDRKCDNELSKMPYYTAVKESLVDIKLRLNPQLAKEKERDEEIGELKRKIGGIESSIGNIEALLKNISNTTSKKKE